MPSVRAHSISVAPMSRTAFTLNPPGCGVNECNGDVSSIDTLVCSPAVFVLALVEMREMIFACTSSARGWFYRLKLPLYGVEICRLEHRRNVMVNLRKVVVANDEPEWGGGASKRTLRGRLVQYLPLLGFVFAAVSSTLGAVFLVGGRDLLTSLSPICVAGTRRGWCSPCLPST